ncbi:nucleotide sugar dehydrogenase [Candidatus Gottesmanbacteria bacterium]|nr:nucleotide sugar dehydrogenase [Candidatus Gottesmanbacteria bacterium]
MTDSSPFQLPAGKVDICIVGGGGHVGFPLGLAFANKNLQVTLYDTNQNTLEKIAQGKLPFAETGADKILKKVLNKSLWLSNRLQSIAKAKYIIIAIGTPVDDHLNPNLKALTDLFKDLQPFLDNHQCIIIRSTVYPRTCIQISTFLSSKRKGKWHIAYCPERIVQGKALIELSQLPQIIAGLTQKSIRDASYLFKKISPSIVKVTIDEAELAKLFSNAWRYIQFAVANQFYMIANEFEVDFNKVRKAMVKGYGRASSLPTAGFAAGPCLLKDTLQLAAFNTNNFTLGNVAVMVNEGLPNYIVEKLRENYDLKKIIVGILGMAFKADSDDSRDSLSYKLGKILRFHGANVLYSDEYVKDSTFVTKEKLLKHSNIVIIGVPHRQYKNLVIPKKAVLIDLWGVVKSEE